MPRLACLTATVVLCGITSLAAQTAPSPTATPTPTPTATPEAPEGAASPAESATGGEGEAKLDLLPAGTLTEEERAAAVRIDALTVPTPGELLAAVGKVAQPNWQSVYRKPIPTSYTSRAQIALNLGGLIADGYLAVEAADAQQVKNTGKDIITLARALGVSENVLGRGSSITDFADSNEWSVLKEELEATQNEVKLAMQAQGDQDFIILVTIGGWTRGADIVSSWLAANYDEKAARLLRQPAIVEFMRAKMQDLPKRMKEDDLVDEVEDQLQMIEQLVTFPPSEPPTREQVDRLRVLTSQLVKDIADRTN